MAEHIKKINSCILEFFNQFSGKSTDESTYNDFNEILQTTESIVSGGFIVSCLTGDDFTKGDIDIYVNKKNSKKLVKLLIQKNFALKIQDSHIAPAYDQSFFRKNNIMARIPFINKENKNIIDVMVIPDNIYVRSVASNFDLTFCEVWWDGEELDGTNIEDTLNKRGFLRKDYEIHLVQHFNSFILKRIKKYNKRGFDIKYESKLNITNSLIDYGNSIKTVESGEKWLVSYIYKLLLKLKEDEITNQIGPYLLDNQTDLELYRIYYSVFWMLSDSSDNMMDDYTMDELKKIIDNNNLIRYSDRFFSHLLARDEDVDLKYAKHIPEDSYAKVILFLLCLYDDYLVETRYYNDYAKHLFTIFDEENLYSLIEELKPYLEMNKDVLFDTANNVKDAALGIKKIFELRDVDRMFTEVKPCNLKTIQRNNIETIEEQCKNINQSTNTHLDTSLNFIIVTDDGEFYCVNSKEILQNILNNNYKIIYKYNYGDEQHFINMSSIVSNNQSNTMLVSLCELKTIFYLVQNNLQICYIKKNNSQSDMYNLMICNGSNCKNTNAVDLMNDFAPDLSRLQDNNPPQVRLSRRVMAGRSTADTNEPVARSLDFDDDSDDEDNLPQPVSRSLDFEDSDDDVDVIIDTNITSEDLELTLNNDGWELLTLKDDSFVLKGENVVIEGQYTDFIFYKFGSSNSVRIDSVEDDNKFEIVLENDIVRDKIMYKVYKLNEPFDFKLFKNPGDYDDTILFRQTEFDGKIVPVFITYSKEQDPYTDGDYNFVKNIVSEGGYLDISYNDNMLLMSNDEYDFDFVLVDELSKYDLHRIINFVKYYSQ